MIVTTVFVIVNSEAEIHGGPWTTETFSSQPFITQGLEFLVACWPRKASTEAGFRALSRSEIRDNEFLKSLIIQEA